MFFRDTYGQVWNRTCIVSAAIAALALLSVLDTATIPGTAEGEKTALGSLLSRALSTPSSRVAIGAVAGALSSDATIRDVAISDRDGVWLKLDQARLVWRRVALLSRRLEIDRLEIGRLEVLRRPLPSPASATPEPEGSLLSGLPVKVEIKGFRLGELVLGEFIAGQPARLTADGKAKLGAPAEGLDLDVNVRRLDAAGRFAARLLFVPQGERLEVKASLVEPAGGLLSKGADLPGRRRSTSTWTGAEPSTPGTRASISTRARASAPRARPDSRASARNAASASISPSRIEGLLPGPAVAVFSGTTKLEGGLRFSDSGAFGIDRLELTSRTARLETRGSFTADHVADFTISARAVPTDGGVTKAGEAEFDSLVFDGSFKGPLGRPRLERLAQGRWHASRRQRPRPHRGDPQCRARRA